jgi:aryl-phospho-beta-D-glucosidase BglC (GH1 family)
VDSYKRLCRNFERECLKAGLQDRIWNGPPIASKIFGKSEEYGDLSGNGSAGWKLNAYNDVQYDLITRLHGFKLVRIPVYENLMTGGSLKKIDDLLLNPKEENQKILVNWISRKLI